MSDITKYIYILMLSMIFGIILGASESTKKSEKESPESCPRDVKKSGDTCACPKGSQSILGTCVKDADGKLVCKCSY